MREHSPLYTAHLSSPHPPSQEVIVTLKEELFTSCVKVLSRLCPPDDSSVICVDSEENGVQLVQVGWSVYTSLVCLLDLFQLHVIASGSPLPGGQDVDGPALYPQWLEGLVALRPHIHTSPLTLLSFTQLYQTPSCLC